MDKDKFELLKMVVELSENESDRYWQRSNFMLTANTGLVAILVFTLQNSLVPQDFVAISLIPSLLGLILSLTWVRIILVSKYYTRRWHLDMEAIIASDEFMSEWIRGRNRPRLARPVLPGFLSRLFGFNTAAYAFVGLWSVSLIVLLVRSI